jgi:hypothetical protein
MGDGGGFQQIIIIGLFLLFGLADLIARWARGRVRSQQPRDPLRRPADDDAFQVDMPWRNEDPSDVIVVERRPERAAAPVPVPTSDRSARDRSARDRSARDRTSSVRQSVSRSAPVRPPASRLASGGISARDRIAAGVSGARARRLTFNADDARRGIIAMTVLGPCRALEDAERLP